MPFKIPKLVDSHCLFLAICARIKECKGGLKEQLAKEREWTAARGERKAKTLFHLATGMPNKDHLHLDFALPRYFGRNRAPKVNRQLSDVTEAMALFSGCTADASVKATFQVSLDQLPESGLLRTVMRREGIGTISFRLTQGTLSITGAPTSTLSWRVLPDDKSVRTTIEASRLEKVDDEYAQRFLDWITDQHRLFVMGKAENAAI
jgi:hypothetical protein